MAGIHQHICADRGEELKFFWWAAEEERTGTATSFAACGYPLVTVPSLKYLNRILLESYDDLMSVVQNLRKSQKKWYRLSCVLGRMGGRCLDARTVLCCSRTCGTSV